MEKLENITKEEKYSDTNFINILETIFKECPDGVVYKNKKQEYLWANPVFCELYNIKNQKTIIGKTIASFLSKENQKLIQRVSTTINKENQSFNFIMNTKNKIFNITSYPIINKKEFQGILSIIRDITHEENIKEKFVSKHSQLKSLLENIPMLIYMQDKELNYITGTKPSLCFLQDGYDAFSNTTINRNKNSIEEYNDNQYVLKNNKVIVKEQEFTDFKQSPHWYKIYKVPINDFNGNITGFITLANNIDAEKQLQAQRETFVASLGHDLKNPTIAQIRGLELLLKGDFGEISEEQKELLEMVLDSCRYMNGMLASLLATYRNYGGVVKLNFSDFSLSLLIEECVSEMIYVAKDKDISITLINEIKKDIIFADRVQIKRVIMNLLSNGIKYAYKNSVLKLFLYSEKNNACFKFENESPYIPDEKQKAIFAQYVSYTYANKEQGIGLGLYASKKIIDGHNGNIYVISKKENKNIFGFKIPIKQDPNECKEIHF